jgi:hypothetical protein
MFNIRFSIAEYITKSTSVRRNKSQIKAAKAGNIIFFLSLLLCSSVLMAQSKFTLSGYVKDSLHRRNANWRNNYRKWTGKGVTSNQYGFYSITLQKGEYPVICTFVGYEPIQINLDLSENKQFSFLLPPKIAMSAEVIVSSKRRDANVKNAQMGKIDLSITRLNPCPLFLVK